MKPSKFKVRHIIRNRHIGEQIGPEENTNSPSHSPDINLHHLDSASKDLFESIKQMLRSSLSIEKVEPANLENRDKKIYSKIRDFKQEGLNDDLLEEWIGDVCRQVTSTAFHNYLTQGMTFEQAKVYCCQNILRNISLLVERNKVDSSVLRKIDTIMVKKILPYLQLKYPLNQAPIVSKNLNRIVKQINNMENLPNDFIYNSAVVWEHRNSGDYNDLIMRTLNEMVLLTDEDSSDQLMKNQQRISNFEDFDAYITKIFQNIYDPFWMKKKPQSGNEIESPTHEKFGKTFDRGDELEKYREKTQQYTHYDVGRKIPESVSVFSEEQINSKQLIIKSPQIMRVLTKWCQELWEKFQNENYFVDRTEGLAMLKSKENNFIHQSLRKYLKQQMEKEKYRIQRYMSNVESNLYAQEFKILESQLISKEAFFLDRYERICGKFSSKVVDNLKKCMTLYLNRLIHGLMVVSEAAYKKQLKDLVAWPSAPNLLSFKAGDLLRCRITSREKELVRLYEQLLWISQKDPDKMKIIRVKNRLKTGNNDLLINVFFNKKLTAELQLKVKSNVKTSNFSVCSYQFCHFLYEIQRSYFGPITELCSIITNLDLKSKVYRDLVEKENLKVETGISQEQCSQHAMERITDEPFICSSCGRSYATDNFVLLHTKCKSCNNFKCCFCQIKERQDKDLTLSLIQDQLMRKNIFPKRCTSVPSLGIYASIEGRGAQNQYYLFKTLQFLGKYYVFVSIDNSVKLHSELKTEKSRNFFLSQNLVYQYCGEEPDCFKSLTLKRAFEFYICPAEVENYYKLEKQILFPSTPESIQLDTMALQNILSQPFEKKSVKQIDLAFNSLQNLDFIPQDLSKLQKINLVNNQIQKLDAIEKFKKLNVLICQHNKITSFPVSICSLPLKYINLGWNKIQKLPTEFENLQTLQTLVLASNNFESFPISLTKLINLKKLDISQNKLQAIPDEIGRLINLRLLNLQQNHIKRIPQDIQKLSKIEILNLSKNQQMEIDVSFNKMQNLQQFKLNFNKYTLIPHKLNGCNQLKTLDLSLNKLKKLDFSQIYLTKIEVINLRLSQIHTIQSLEGIKNVTNIDLTRNFIYALPNQFFELAQLEVLSLSHNCIVQLPHQLSLLKKLRDLDVSENEGLILPSDMTKWKLEILNISACALFDFPISVTHLHNLKSLFIQNNIIKSLPKDIKKLQKLERFWCHGNQIRDLPLQITALKNIKDSRVNQKCPVSDGFLAKYLQFPLLQIIVIQSQIQSLPEEITMNEMLQRLVLDKNNISIIPRSISNLKVLKELSLIDNKLIKIGFGLFQLKELSKLILAGNLLEDLPEYFDQLEKLSQLDVSRNKLTSLPNSLQTIMNPSFKLSYSGNNITAPPLWAISMDFYSTDLMSLNSSLSPFPPLFPNQNYKNIKLNGNNFAQISSELFDLYRAQQLDLSSNQIKVIPSGIKRMRSLKRLILTSNLIEKIPTEICELPLEWLDIKKNPLKTLPQDFIKLNKLKLGLSPNSLQELKKNGCLKLLKNTELVLENLQLTEIPVQIGQIGFMRGLDISNNKLNAFPREVIQLKGLFILKINGQPIKNFPDQIGQLIQLKALEAEKCQLKILPHSFMSLIKLQRLDLTGNEITNIPQQISKLAELVELKLDSNLLKELPKWTFEMLKLNKISLSHNQITQIPTTILGSAVKQLDLSFNLIENFPDCMENMKELKINLSGNSVLKKSAILKIKHLLDDSSLKEVRNVTIPVPRCENRDCWKCGQRLEFPLYWLRWEEGDVLGCIKCVEEKSTKEGHHFAYEKNSILLLEQWDAIRMHRMGNNLSPKNIPAHTQKHTYYCNIKSLQGYNNVGQPRYACLVCLVEDPSGEYADFCPECLDKLVARDEEIIEKCKPFSHERSHPMLRILYNSVDYFHF